MSLLRSLLTLLISTRVLVVQAQLPPVNQQIIAFVDANMGKRIDRGECWDLAAAALNAANATWDGRYAFGTVVDRKKEEILPGDIIQFERVVVDYKVGNSVHHESMGHHTAIVHDVLGEGNYTLAHQNFGPAGRKVSLSELKMEHITKGKYTIFRPVE